MKLYSGVVQYYPTLKQIMEEHKLNKLTFENLTIETTRKCNMKCAHCLRGNSQNVDIDYRYIDNILDQTEVIGHLDITGGEPTLNLNALEYILNGLCKRGIPLLEFGLNTNGLIYSERFIDLIRWCKQIIDVSCSNCFKNGNEYQPQRYLSRCNIGVSLDRYHEQHDICMEHYQKYKAALADYADVLMIMRGNKPKHYGRAKSLDVPMVNLDAVFELSKKQRIELLSKDVSPACRYFEKYHMFHENQRIVCCKIYMNALGEISSEWGGAWEYENCDQYPKICSSNDPIWESILNYNESKIPCLRFETIRDEVLHDACTQLSLEDFLKTTDDEESKDEQMHYLKLIEAEEKERLEKLAHPKSFSEAITNFNLELANYLKARENLRKTKEHEAKDWKQIAAEAACYSYYDGDERGGRESQDSTTSKDGINKPKKIPTLSDTRKIPQQVTKDSDIIRCFNCGEVIQYQGHNINSMVVDKGLLCQYCMNINSF